MCNAASIISRLHHRDAADFVRHSKCAAGFVFKLFSPARYARRRVRARRALRLEAAYSGEGRRAALATDDPIFAAAFDTAKTRVRSMEVRYVQETDPLRQALLEIYGAVVLATPYNDFNTH
ncbi:MAG: hypothetical protein HY657_02510 [Acidobacteria bacterium]|nr:hypothetical protein [Acidobacteriota bacterium]